MKLATVAVALMFVVGCGSDDGEGGPGPTPGGPQTYALDGPTAWRLAPEQQFILGPFTVPNGATVAYVVMDMPSGIGADAMDFIVAGDAQVRAGGALEGYALREGVASVTAATPPLPAGAYDLTGWCRNLIDDCLFTTRLTATY